MPTTPSFNSRLTLLVLALSVCGIARTASAVPDDSAPGTSVMIGRRSTSLVLDRIFDDVSLSTSANWNRTTGARSACFIFRIAVMMNVNLDDEPQTICQLMRLRDRNKLQLVSASLSQMRDGNRAQAGRDVTRTEALSGRLRLARRGNEVYFLFAEGDSQNFQMVGQQTVNTANSRTDGISLRVLADGNSSCSVVWKSIHLRAENLDC